MDQSLWRRIVRDWIEDKGRQRAIDTVEFPEGQVIVLRPDLKISSLANAVYLNSPPTVYAVITTPEGENRNIKGGFSWLQAGQYGLQYVDKRDLSGNLPVISETTSDGAKVSFAVYIRYRITDPIKVLEIQNPTQTFFSTIEFDIKEYIRTHKHDDIVDVHQGIDDNNLSLFIKQQQNHHIPISRAFVLIDMGIKQRDGDPKLIEMRKNFQVQEKQNQADSTLFRQKQELERMVAERDAQIKDIRAQTDQKVRKMEVEIDNERKRYQRKQERSMKAWETMKQVLSTPGYPRNPNEIKAIIEEMVNAIEGDEFKNEPQHDTPETKPSKSEQPTPRSGDKVEKLTNTLLNLLNGRNSNNKDG